MSYQSRLDAALAAITDHNNSVGESADKIDCDTFVANLKKMGGTSEAALAACTWEDLEHCGIPRILARSISGIFRDRTEPDDDPVKDAARLKPEELVAKYDLNDPYSPYGKRLKSITHDKFVIIEDGKINIGASQKELRRIMDGFASRDQINVKGQVLKTYRIGEKPGRCVGEHCIYGTPLDEDGCSDKGVAWGSLSLPVQQLLNIAVFDTKELQPNRYEEFDLFDMVSGKEFNHLALRYPKAAVKFQELENLGDLPRLAIQMGNGNNEPNNPFGKNRTY